MELSINDLGMVWETVYEARTKAYEIGLILKVAVDTLDSIDKRYDDPSDKLREVLKTWLRTASKPTWQDILDALKSRVVGQPRLASDIEAKYCTTVEAAHVSRETIPEVLPQQPTTADTQVHTLQQALQDSRELRIKDQQDSCMHTLQQELRIKDQRLQDSQRQVQELTEQLLAMKQPGPCAPPQTTVLQHATGDRQLQAMKRLGPPPQKTVMQQKSIRDMRWQRESKAPEKMYRGSAAADSNMAYFHGDDSTTVHSYDSNTREWHRLPATPYKYSTLVVVHHVLTMVGGVISGGATDSLLSLIGEGRGIKWLPNLPAMPTKRYNTAAVCSGRSLIVTGGKDDGDNRLSTVEVLDTDTRQWSIASSPTHPFSRATISICGERLYMLGGDQTGRMTRSVLSCSVPELLQSCQPQPLAGKLRTAPANQSTIWRRVADAPHYWSSCATLCGQLVAVGGRDEAPKSTSAITGYNETTDSWEAMGNMPTARRMALVAILNGKMMVVGGVGGLVVGTATDVVEILC